MNPLAHLLFFLVTFLSTHSAASPIDVRAVWFQHTNQIVTFLEHLSNQTDGSAMQCRNSLQLLVTDAKNNQFYANKMIDSIGRPTSGILEGRRTYLGQYDECLAAKGPLFAGKYCIAQIALPTGILMPQKRPSVEKANPSTFIVKLGICLPSTCSTLDVTILAEQFSSMFQPALAVGRVECMESDDSQQDNGDYMSLAIFSAFCALIFLLIVIGTIFGQFSDNYHSSQIHLIANPKNIEEKPNPYQTTVHSTTRQLLLAFSLRENMKKIISVDTSGSDSIGVFHGIKFLAMIWIIFSHSISFSSQWINFNNPQDMAKTSKSLFSQIIINGTFSVDCFFFISGYLVTHLLLKYLKQVDNKLNLTLFYLKRYLRMTPTMMTIIGFGATMLRYFGNGPEWSNSTVMFDRWCRTNWWVNSLYLHNFVNMDNMCLSHSWYSAVDTQFYLISPFLVILLNKRPKVGVIMCSLLLAGSVAITGILTFLNNYPAVPYSNDKVELATLNSYYQNVYIKPYCRIGPYLIGMLLAYFMFNTRKSVTIAKPYLILGWTFTLLATLGVILLMLPANQGNIPSPAYAAVYSATSRLVWSLGLSWITFVSLHNYGGLVSAFLCAKVWVPLSRLTYCAYLVHPIIIAIFYGSRHQTFDYSFYLIFYFALSNICITYMVSFLVALFVEYPIVAISHVAISHVLKRP